MKTLHVVPYQGRWALRWGGSPSVAAVYQTKAEAVTAGRRLARAHKAELFIHKKDGTIQERESYGRDPFPPIG